MKNYRLTIVAEERYCGFYHILYIENTETTVPNMDTDGIVERINAGKDMKNLKQIIENADVHDIKYTFTISDEMGNVTYQESMWESDAAKIAMEV